MTSPVRFGFLSTARINDKVMAGARESDRVEVVAVASRDAGRAEAYAAERGIPHAHGSYEALLSDPDVDVVYIPLPNGMHVEWTKRALAAGKHVLVEKPFSRHPDEVEETFDIADAHGLVVSEAFMWRHNPQTAELLQRVGSGAIGRLRLVRAAFSFRLTAAGDIRLDPALDGGALMDVGCYCVNGMRAVAGEPAYVSGEQALGESGVDVVFTGTAACADEVVAHFDCGFALPYRAVLEVVGEEAALVVPDPWHVYEAGIELHRDSRVELVAVPPASSYRLELENVAAAILGEAPLLLGREDAVGQARTIDALYRAAATGAAVELLPAPRLEAQ
jgi:D-xylose 1-dehydrogenase (NADP+, D-xylono-1,5-lactone-forming)